MRQFLILADSISEERKEMMLKALLLESAQIVLATLNSTALQDIAKVGNTFSFDVVVIDEAAQSVEPSCLIPLQYGCEHCILIGDPMQLPATVLSFDAQRSKYSQSLFDRLAKNGHLVNLLNTQFRCHPTISRFISLQFYDGLIVDDPSVTVPSYTKSIKIFGQSCSPMIFLDVSDGTEASGRDGVSFKNVPEVEAVTKLHRIMLQDASLEHNSIGIISPYSEQVKALRRSIRQDERTEINTVDSFQGREFDIVLFSTVRSNARLQGRSNIGFLNDKNRLNVAITRAKHLICIIGNKKTLIGSSVWRPLISYIERFGSTHKLQHGHSIENVSMKISQKRNKDGSAANFHGYKRQKK
eukprot:CAMPEP_0184015878 /NCGR_PEP_ID=MMETSP0954-20121128/6602_1 /TAXON_ID=627963 /ORGANISM="Aplanochytrium sp, Strain PBS07" /LENGTH=355 /DNA_ID=CAMNT_0026296805 /DNA_START=51 /DNA_END=1118 /DNA_ORIENTATION=-